MTPSGVACRDGQDTFAPRLSVVVPTYQRRELLAQTLPGILDQELGPHRFEVVVVVDGSTDGTQQMLAERFPCATLRTLEIANAGPAAARNAGIEAARGDLVLLLDDDIVCPHGLLAAHIAAHESGPKVVFGPVFGLEGKSTAAELTRLALQDYYTRMRDEWDPQDSPVAYAAPNTSIPRRALLEAGGFDVRFAHAHEDADLGLRLRAMGLTFVYLPEAPVYQQFTKNADQLVRGDAAVHGRGEILLCRTHPALRRQSFLAELGGDRLPARWSRAAAVRSPLSPDWLLRPCFSLAESLPVSVLRRQRLRLLSQRGHLARLRAAAAAAGGWHKLNQEFGRRCSSLLYHHVGPRPPGMPATLTITPDRFERQMRYLHRRGFTAISARRWLDWIERGVALPGKPFVLTFDDAYSDLANRAFPLLETLGFGATVFVVTGRIGGSNDWDTAPGFPSLPLLDRQQIRYWSGRGIEFGAHTRTHRSLEAIPPAAAQEEVRGSGRDLETLIDGPVRTFAYPFGITSVAAIATAAETYGLSFTCDEGMNSLATDLHRQRRTMVQPSDTLLDIEMRVRLGWSPFGRARSSLRIRSRLRSLTGMRVKP